MDVGIIAACLPTLRPALLRARHITGVYYGFISSLPSRRYGTSQKNSVPNASTDKLASGKLEAEGYVGIDSTGDV